jgi:hypothetical protein
MGVRGTLFKNYLSGCSQCVDINVNKSEMEKKLDELAAHVSSELKKITIWFPSNKMAGSTS